jgi:hypothetical protein
MEDYWHRYEQTYYMQNNHSSLQLTIFLAVFFISFFTPRNVSFKAGVFLSIISS